MNKLFFIFFIFSFSLFAEIDSDLGSVLKEADSDLSPIVKEMDSDLSSAVKEADSDLSSGVWDYLEGTQNQKAFLDFRTQYEETHFLFAKEDRIDLSGLVVEPSPPLSESSNLDEIDFETEESIDESERALSSKKIQKSSIQRDQSFNLPETKQIKGRKVKRLDLTSVAPTASQFYYASDSDEAELERVYIEEERHLFKLLKKNRNAELTLRLGALYAERSRLIAYKIQTDYEKKMQAFKSGSRKSKPYLNLKPAQAYNRKSLKLFEDFKKSYPNHKRMDEVLFFLGFNFYQLKNQTQGIKYYTELEQRFPNSFYLYESRFQLGEHYFKLKKWKQSLDYYNKVSKNKRGKFYFFSLYKIAWCLYKLNKADRGLIVLKRIIEEGRNFKVVSNKDQVFTFTEEAIEDLVLFYTYSKKPPSSAKSFFLSLLDDETAWRLLKRLAYAYRDTGQAKAGLILFEELIKQDPAGKSAFDYKYQMVEMVYNFGSSSDLVKWLKNG